MSKFQDENSFMIPKITQQDNHILMSNVYKRTKSKFVNIDSKFCDEYASSREKKDGLASLTYTLPDKITSVVSMKVKTAELPASFYNFSKSLQNNYCSVDDTILDVSDGSFTTETLLGRLNSRLSTSVDVSFQFTFDSLQQKVVMENNSIHDITVDFGILETGGVDKYNLKNKLGWYLGFREPSYTVPQGGEKMAESILDLYPTKYLYLVVDDFQQNTLNNFVVPLYQKLLNKCVLARISLDLNVLTFGKMISTETFGNLVSAKREYHGKADIQRLKLEIVNEWGQVMNLNLMDFSFCLEIEYE
jgi:hypothetical protein